MGDILDQSGEDILAALRTRRLSARDFMQETLSRISAVNPAINAIVSLRPTDVLLAEAEAADAALNAGTAGPLTGLPFAIKDLCATAGLRTTWGSPLYADFIPAKDDALAACLRKAGAIIIGKTNTPEMGLGSHTFNPVHGATQNPYATGKTPGGSSGGAAAALATRMVALADGSDMMGSLRNPAAFCNVYGFRPTWDLIAGDATGDTYLHVMSTNGPMARSPRDLALLLDVMAGVNPRQPHGRPPAASYLAGLPTDVRGRRIGWLGDWGGALPMEPGILAQCETALTEFTEMGCTVTPVATPFSADDMWESWCQLRHWSNAASMAEDWADPARRALIKPELAWEIQRGQALSALDVHRASTIRSQWYATLADLFTRYDALVLPSAQVWPFSIDIRYPESISGHSMDTYHRWMQVVVPVSLAGVPALNVPIGFSPAQDGAPALPMGMQIFGAAGQDAQILQLGHAYHQRTEWPQRHPALL